MAATPYRPISFNDRSLTQDKLQQLQNNVQWLFENTGRMRYSANGIIRDSGMKIIAGKTAYGVQTTDYVNVDVYFGSFFNSACKPIVTATVESLNNARVDLTIWGVGGRDVRSEIDYRGFTAHAYTQQPTGWQTTPIRGNGWLHWVAVGF